VSDPKILAGRIMAMTSAERQRRFIAREFSDAICWMSINVLNAVVLGANALDESASRD
jgi:hypothetical protein